MNWGIFIKKIIIFVAVLTFILSTIYVIESTAGVPMPVGIAGKITVDGNDIDNGYAVTVKNNNTGETIKVYTENGYFVAGISGGDLDTIIASISYEDNTYSNTTIVNVSRTTQWINITISTGSEPPEPPNPPYTNKRPVVVLPDAFNGYIGNPITFDASQCYDPDGYITKYEWNIYDYPPFTKIGSSFTKIWNTEKTIVGTLTIYDDQLQTSSKSFSITISKKEANDSSDNNDSTEDDSNNNSTNTINITIPPVANFTIEGILEYNSTIYLNSTSYDPDGEIVNHTWDIDGYTAYGENITYILPNKDSDYYYTTISLTVTDNDGIINKIDKTIRVNSSTANNTDEHNISIKFDDYVIITVKDNDNHTIVTAYGKDFLYRLPEGSYHIVYAYKGNEYNKNINLSGDEELHIPLPSNNTPIENWIVFVSLIFTIFIYKRYKYGRNKSC